VVLQRLTNISCKLSPESEVLSHSYVTFTSNSINSYPAAGKWRIIALTNNFSHTSSTSIPQSELEFLGWQDGGVTPPHLRALFDDFCDSSTLGMRKPEVGFYLAACERNGIKPGEAVFLDDIGM
jgi:hypothetical protein